LRAFGGGELVVAHGRHFHVQVDAVEQGARDFGDVAFHHAGAADAFFVGVVVVAAGAGVRCIVVIFSLGLKSPRILHIRWN